MNVVYVVEFVDQVAVVVCALVAFPSCLVGHSVDLGREGGERKRERERESSVCV